MDKHRAGSDQHVSKKRWAREEKGRSNSLLRRLDLIVWAGIVVVCAVFVFTMLNIGFSVPIERAHDEQVNYVQQQGTNGLKQFCSYLANPEDPKKAFGYLKLLNSLDTPELRKTLIDSIDSQAENVCLVSYALCFLNDPAGLPQFYEIIDSTDFGSNTWCNRNFFSSDFMSVNPLVSKTYRDDDVVWAIQLFESTIEHTFAGGSWSEKRDDLIRWWNESKNRSYITWQKDFLVSNSEVNRSEAFKVLDRLTLQDPDVKKDLIAAMNNESCESLRHHMGTVLFSRGYKESLPVFNDYVQRSTTPADISNILAIASLHVKLPREYRNADTWVNGCRRDELPYKIFIKWWNLNHEFLKHNGISWEAEYPEEDNNPLKDITPRVKDDDIEIEKGPYD